MGRDLEKFLKCTELSTPPEAKVLRSGLKATAMTQPRWPFGPLKTLSFFASSESCGAAAAGGGVWAGRLGGVTGAVGWINVAPWDGAGADVEGATLSGTPATSTIA